MTKSIFGAYALRSGKIENFIKISLLLIISQVNRKGVKLEYMYCPPPPPPKKKGGGGGGIGELKAMR